MPYPIRKSSLEALRMVKTEGPIRIRFAGSNKTMLLDMLTASAILTVYDALSEENKAKVEPMMQDKNKFLWLATFCFGKVKLTSF